MRIIIIISGLLLLTSVSCKKSGPAPFSDSPPATFDQLFDDFWNKMNVNYLYWDIDTTDWDGVYRRYKPVFSKLDIQNDQDLAASVRYFREMTEGLIDHHFVLSFMDSTIDPAIDRVLRDPQYRSPLSYLVHDESYLDSGYLIGSDYKTDPANPLIAVAGKIQKNILFFGCNRFSLGASFRSVTGNSIQPLLNYFFSELQGDPDVKAVILDVRDNPGGDVADLNFLAGRFTNKPVHFGYTRYKSGNGRLNYTPWITADISPASQKSFSGPVIILADRYSASMGEIFAMAMRAMPNCKIVGETTFGATGPLVENAVYNAGSFNVSPYIAVETSSSEFKYIDGKIYEGKGFAPDFPVSFNRAAINSGIDSQMNKAIMLAK